MNASRFVFRISSAQEHSELFLSVCVYLESLIGNKNISSGRLDDTALAEHSELSAVRKSTVILNDGLVAVKMLHGTISPRTAFFEGFLFQNTQTNWQRSSFFKK